MLHEKTKKNSSLLQIMKGHWSRTCYTADHLVKLYQASLKEKGKEKMETNLIDGEDPVDITHLEVSDFF